MGQIHVPQNVFLVDIRTTSGKEIGMLIIIIIIIIIRSFSFLMVEWSDLYVLLLPERAAWQIKCKRPLQQCRQPPVSVDRKTIQLR